MATFNLFGWSRKSNPLGASSPVLAVNEKIAIVIGSEGKGIRKLTLEDSDFIATIPMQGTINSLNVSAACSAILFERLRQVLDS